MDEEREEYEPRISLVEILLIVPYLLIIDLFEVLIVFLGFDDFWIGDIFASPITLYLWLKGARFNRYLATQILEFLPYVGALPLLTVGFLLTVYLDHNPKISAIAQTATATKGPMRRGRNELEPQGVGGQAAREGGTSSAGRPAGRAVSLESEAPPGTQGEFRERRLKPSFEQLSAERGTPLDEPLPLSQAEQQKIFEEIPKTNRANPRPNNGNVIINDNGDVDLRNVA